MIRPIDTRAHRHGLTIVEVIVVTGVVSLVLGLLLPALGRFQTAARQMHCQTNLRQMAIAAQQYTTVWDAYPTALRYEQTEGGAKRIAWDWVTTFDGQLIEPGPLWQLTDHPDRVMQAPGYDSPSNFEGDPYTGYNYNTDYIGGEAETPAFGWSVVRRGVPPHACRRTSETAIFGVGGFSGGANKFMRAPCNPHNRSLSVVYSGGQAFCYAGSTNVAYLDGHVDAVDQPRKGEHAEDALLQQLGYPRNGFLSDAGSAYDPR